jgi:hypothetical protein
MNSEEIQCKYKNGDILEYVKDSKLYLRCMLISGPIYRTPEPVERFPANNYKPMAYSRTSARPSCAALLMYISWPFNRTYANKVGSVIQINLTWIEKNMKCIT